MDEAEWDGTKLYWQAGAEADSIVLAETGRAIVLTIDPISGGGSRRTIEARRVRSLN